MELIHRIQDYMPILINIFVGAVIPSVAAVVIKSLWDSRMEKNDRIQVISEVDYVLKGLDKKEESDVISLMLRNVRELREYYVISKRQANRSFTSAWLACILGFIIFIVGIIANNFSEQTIILYTTISGGIVELISGLFFWLYNRTLGQLNLYHERLGRTEKYLTSMKLIERMSESKRDDTFRFLIESILDDGNATANKD